MNTAATAERAGVPQDPTQDVTQDVTQHPTQRVTQGVTVNEHGLEVDERFGRLPDRHRVHSVAQALRQRGFEVLVVDDVESARSAVLDLLPADAEVFTMSSMTLRVLGLQDEINESGRFRAMRPRIYAMDFATQQDEIRKLGAGADWTVGSVQAVTDDGRVVVASGSGSQIALYAFGSGRVVYVVGAQKIVKDLDEAFDRVQRWSWPHEDSRNRRERGEPAHVLKTLVIDGELYPGRASVVLVNAALGF